MKNKQEKILYLMHIDWNWIKQRPQFLAEGLARDYKITCIYPFSWRLKKKIKNSHTSVKLIPVLQIPFNKKKIVRVINRFITNTFTKLIAFLGNYQIIIVPSPWQYKEWMKKKKVIYDCMDNYKAFLSKSEQKDFWAKEKDIVLHSTVISASSDYIIDELIRTYGIERSKIHLIRNGYNNSGTKPIHVKKYERKGKFKIVYIGTIANWFDFELLQSSLKVFEDVEYHLAGPIDKNISIPKNENILYDGIIQHDKLREYVSQFDCLIMPFIVNDIVAAVDPVKLYEYVDFNMNIICVYYDEIKRFDPFVYFYTSSEDYYQQLDYIKQKNLIKYSDKTREDFLLNNGWNNRVEVMSTMIRSILKK